MEAVTQEPEARLRQLLASVSAYWLASVFGLLTTFARTSLTGRWLGPHGTAVIGQLSLVLIFAAVVSGFGLSTAGTKAIAESVGAPMAARSLAKSLVCLPVLASMALSAVGCLFASSISAALLGSPHYVGFVILTLAAVPPTVAVAGVQAVMLGNRQVARLARASIEAAAVGCLTVIIATWSGGLRGAVISIPCTAYLTFFIFLTNDPWLRRALCGDDWASWAAVRAVAPLGLASLLASAFTTGADVVTRGLLVRTHGLTEAGLYQPAFIFSTVAFAQLATSLGLVLLPTLAVDLSAGRERQAALALDFAVKLGVSCAGTAVILCLVCRGVGIQIAFGSTFARSSSSVGWQLMGEVPRILCYTLGASLLPSGRVRAWLATGLLATAARLILAGLLVQRFGASGLAASFAFEWSLVAVLTWWLTRRSEFRLGRQAAGIVVVCTTMPAAAFAIETHGHLGSLLIALAMIAFLGSRLSSGRLLASPRRLGASHEA